MVHENTLETWVELNDGELVDVEVYYTYEPGEDGVWTFSNGDPGYPGTDDNVEISRIVRINEDDPKAGQEVSYKEVVPGTYGRLKEEALEREQN